MIGAQNPVYVVQTNTQVVERCLLMTTDPGDLVLDPTCVRKGTMILRPPFIPPQAGGEIDHSQTTSPYAFESDKTTPKDPSPHACGGLGG